MKVAGGGQRTDCGHGDDMGHAQMFHGPDIGAMVQFAGQEAMATAGKIASFSLPAVMMVKEAVNRAYESTLSEGVLFERRLFHAAFEFHRDADLLLDTA